MEVRQSAMTAVQQLVRAAIGSVEIQAPHSADQTLARNAMMPVRPNATTAQTLRAAERRGPALIRPFRIAQTPHALVAILARFPRNFKLRGLNLTIPQIFCAQIARL
jgi:hypothetical protein